MAIATLAKNLFWPVKPPGEEYVKKADLPLLVAPMVKEYVTKAELREMIAPLLKGHEELSKYTHDSVHEMRNDSHAIRLRLENIRLEIAKDVEHAMASLAARMDQSMALTNRLLAYHEVGEATKRQDPQP